MACLYIASGTVNDRARVVKVGISGDDSPWSRMSTISKSKDNPFYAPIRDVWPWASFCFDYMNLARNAETAIRRRVLSTLTQAPTREPPIHIAIPVLGYASERPSGEWLFTSLEHRERDVVICAIDHLSSAFGYIKGLSGAVSRARASFCAGGEEYSERILYLGAGPS